MRVFDDGGREHDAWALWRMQDDPGHRSIVPFAELAYEVQRILVDKPYVQAIHRVARRTTA